MSGMCIINAKKENALLVLDLWFICFIGGGRQIKKRTKSDLQNDHESRSGRPLLF